MAELKLNPENPYPDDYGEGFNFVPVRKGGKITVHGLREALFDMGIFGTMYVLLLQIPEERCEDPDEEMVLDPWDAMKILADYNRCKVYDWNGKEVQ